MQDLTNFHPLHEMIAKTDADIVQVKNMLRKIFQNLKQLYIPQNYTSLPENESGLIKSLYIVKMEQKLRRISRESIIKLDKKTLEKFRKDLTLLSSMKEVEPDKLTVMHGDLHDRNIMVRTGGRGSTETEIIDIDAFSFSGDYVYDIGELSASIGFVGRIDEIDSAFLSPNYKDVESDKKKDFF